MSLTVGSPATGKVVVRAGHETVEGRLRARVDITDSGPGIPEHLLGRLFEPFYTTRATGTGLGLAVVKRFVDAHGGEVKVTSRAAHRHSPDVSTARAVGHPSGACGRLHG